MEIKNTLSYGELVVDLYENTVTLERQRLEVTPLEFKVLVYLVQNPTRYVCAEELLEKVWHCADGGTLDQVKSCVKRLRHKLAVKEKTTKYIHTARGWGYRFGFSPRTELNGNGKLTPS